MDMKRDVKPNKSFLGKSLPKALPLVPKGENGEKLMLLQRSLSRREQLLMKFHIHKSIGRCLRAGLLQYSSLLPPGAGSDLLKGNHQFNLQQRSMNGGAKLVWSLCLEISSVFFIEKTSNLDFVFGFNVAWWIRCPSVISSSATRRKTRLQKMSTLKERHTDGIENGLWRVDN